MLRNTCTILIAAAALATAADTLVPLGRLPPVSTVTRAPALLPGPEDALSAALEDAERIDAHSRRFVRYVWLDEGKVEQLKALALAINTVSRAPVLLRPWPVNRYVARLDLRLYAPQEEDTRDWLELWEELRFDPLFSQLITRDSIRGQRSEVRGQQAVVRYNNPALEPALSQLQYLLYSEVPIVHSLYLQFRILSTFKGETELYQTVFGGRYYEFAGIKRSKDKKFTDEDEFFRSLGLEPPVAKLFERLRSDQRAITKRSKVTGKPRRVDMFHAPSGRETTGWGAITHDLRTE